MRRTLPSLLLRNEAEHGEPAHNNRQEAAPILCAHLSERQHAQRRAGCLCAKNVDESIRVEKARHVRVHYKLVIAEAAMRAATSRVLALLDQHPALLEDEAIAGPDASPAG